MELNMLKSLFEEYKDYFRVGAAVSGWLFMTEDEKKVRIAQMEEFFKNFNPPAGMPKPAFRKPDFPTNLPDLDIVKEHFNLIVAENETKMGPVYQADGVFNFQGAKHLIDFGKANNKDVRWHTLVWHNQSPEWIFKDSDGNKVSKELLEERLKNYIFTVGKQFGDDICSVDVVNECISDKNFKLRDLEDRSQWFDIMGPEYIDKAFHWAKEAFPKSSLVINDYNLETTPEKRQGMYELLKGMLDRGVPVDTVGLQMHINMENPEISEIEKTIELYGSLGLNVIVTEMDVSVYKDFQPGGEHEAKKEYTQEILDQQAERYYQLFECFKKESKAGILKDVVFWGITDRFTWKNDFPVPGRTDIPLLFDREGKPKPAFYRLTK